MESLATISAALDALFDLPDSGADPAFSRFLPAAYQTASRPRQTWVEPKFATHFNGLMLRGGGTVRTVFLAAFPSREVLAQFLDRAAPGDLLFLHHPIDLESGDPRGAWGRFFQPTPEATIAALLANQLSLYSCHAPLDYHATLSTSGSICGALDGTVLQRFFPYGRGHAGIIASVAALSVDALEQRLLKIFGISYLDAAGARPAAIERVAIVAGAGDRVEQMRNAQTAGALAYTGEIHSRIDTDYGHEKFAEVERFAASTAMALLGVSHAASEFLVMDREMVGWFTERFDVATVPLWESHWWR